MNIEDPSAPLLGERRREHRSVVPCYIVTAFVILIIIALLIWHFRLPTTSRSVFKYTLKLGDRDSTYDEYVKDNFWLDPLDPKPNCDKCIFNAYCHKSSYCEQRLIIEDDVPISDFNIHTNFDSSAIIGYPSEVGFGNCLTGHYITTFIYDNIFPLTFDQKQDICKLKSAEWKENYAEAEVYFVSQNDCHVLQEKFIDFIGSCQEFYVYIWGLVAIILTCFMLLFFAWFFSALAYGYVCRGGY